MTCALGASPFSVSSWKKQPETKLNLVDARFWSLPFHGEELANVKHNFMAESDVRDERGEGCYAMATYVMDS